MSVIWIVKFVPNQGGASLDLYYRTEARAREIFARVVAPVTILTLKDDFGIEVQINNDLYSRCLTSTAIGAKVKADLVASNDEQFRRLGIPTVAMTESGRHLLEKLVLLKPEDVLSATGLQHVTPELLAVLNHAKATASRSFIRFREKAA